MSKCTQCGEWLFDPPESFVDRTPGGGCHGIYDDQEECPLHSRSHRHGLAWRIGMAIYKDLAGRKGIKHELDACDYDVKEEIILTIGRIAERIVSEPT